jgi:DNA polymerase-3 subunit delta'
MDPAVMPFASVIGHRQTVDLLRHAITHRRVPQSLLFAGPDGIGKRTTALALAQAVNCPNSRDGDACGTCPTCHRIVRGQHADVVVVDTGEKASIGIDVLRDRVLDAVGYRPFEAARRVFIIDGADALTPPAQDALLKTLEEPPPTAILVLVTAYPDTLLATVQSRCRRLRFGPLADADVARVLVERCAIDRVAARTLAATSSGSVGAALGAEQGHAEADREAAVGLLASAARETAAGRLRAADRLVKHGSKRRDRDALGARLAIIASLLRDVAAAQAGAPDVDLDPGVAAVRGAYDIRRATAAFLALADAQTWLERNAGPKIVADWVALTV